MILIDSEKDVFSVRGTVMQQEDCQVLARRKVSYSEINLEQSVARYLADRFLQEGYKVHWFNSRTDEGTGTRTVTITRNLPEEANTYVRQSGTVDSPASIRLPVFTVYANLTKTSAKDRLGIGESNFFWKTNIGIDGFADDEQEWYKIRSLFRRWFGNPDERVNVYDFEQDFNDNNPELLDDPIQFLTADIVGRNFDEAGNNKYYINCMTTAEFVE